MNVNVNLSGEIVDKITSKITERLDEVVNQVLEENIDDLIKDVVQKQLKSVSLMYIQSPEFRQKMLDKVKPVINSMVENSND
jgi:hypothetical protein